MASDLEQFESRLLRGAAHLGIELLSDQIRHMKLHAKALMDWNRKMNLTAIRDPQKIAEKHFLDALAISRCLSHERRIMDMGAGGGFPSLPLKVIHPDISFLLVDAVRKKVTFLNHVIRTIGLEHIRAEHARVEKLSDQEGIAGSFDLVVARGFAGLEIYAALARPMLKAGGAIWAMKGEGGLAEITPAIQANFDISHTEYALPFEKSGRILIRLTPKPVLGS